MLFYGVKILIRYDWGSKVGTNANAQYTAYPFTRVHYACLVIVATITLFIDLIITDYLADHIAIYEMNRRGIIVSGEATIHRGNQFVDIYECSKQMRIRMQDIPITRCVQNVIFIVLGWATLWLLLRGGRQLESYVHDDVDNIMKHLYDHMFGWYRR